MSAGGHLCKSLFTLYKCYEDRLHSIGSFVKWLNESIGYQSKSLEQDEVCEICPSM